ncbi:uncharacterized protein CXorf38 homolog [Stegastes partitus]|uniref:Uncharacterized protein CXorf38 homolog n=1 Tax=Stegastes partitus TaxID=144197 RepID=A0A9Y4MWA9_9TELE|nr:PREDICTED: uncharacterized protein CXorf38 homolog [Stegastes partitus]
MSLAYMPRGMAKKNPDQFDPSALLNLINYCQWFSSVDPKLVREVIRYRNELMHSCDFRVTDEWMRRYRNTMRHFLQQFNDVPRMAAVGQQIDEMLDADLSIHVAGVDAIDSAGSVDGLESDSVNLTGPEISAGLVSQWESELLQEMLQEILQVGAEEGDTTAQDAQQLKKLGGFLQANKDLGERFSAELRAINSLEARH